MHECANRSRHRGQVSSDVIIRLRLEGVCLSLLQCLAGYQAADGPLHRDRLYSYLVECYRLVFAVLQLFPSPFGVATPLCRDRLTTNDRGSFRHYKTLSI